MSLARDAALREYEKAEYDVELAVKNLLNRSHRNTPLRGDMLGFAARALIEEAKRSRRGDLVRAPRSSAPALGDPGEKLQRHAAQCLMDYPMADGSRLGDADRAKLGKQISLHFSAAVSHEAKATWFQDILHGLSPKSTVRHCFSEKMLRDLWEKEGVRG